MLTTQTVNALSPFTSRYTPAGMEKMFQEIGKLVAADTLLPIPQMTHEELKHLESIAEKYGGKLYPPDYFDK
jgi:hypothetical protein